MPDLRDDLRTYVDELARRAEEPLATAVTPPAERDARRSPTRRRPPLMVAAAVAGLMILLAVVLLVTRRPTGGRLDAAGPTTEVAAPTTALGSGNAVQIDPTTDLHDGQTVHVHATGFSPFQMVGIAMCDAIIRQSRNGEVDCDLGTMAQRPADQSGTLDASYVVRQLIRVRGPFDCATDALGCAIGVGPSLQVGSGSSLGTDTPVTFVRGTPRALPTAAMVPSTDLHDGQVVTVTGANFAPGSLIFVSECPPNSDCGYAAFGVHVTADATGAFRQALTLHRTFTVPADLANGVSSETLDCTSGCSIIAVTESASDPQLSADPIPFTLVGS